MLMLLLILFQISAEKSQHGATEATTVLVDPDSRAALIQQTEYG